MSRKMLVVALAGFLIVGIGVAIKVNATEKRTLIEEILVLIKYEDVLSKGEDAFVRASMKNLLFRIPDQNPDAEREMREVVTETIKPYNAAAKQFTIELYADHFTKDELEQMVTFYRTSAGQKLATKLPKILEEGAKFGQRWIRENYLPHIDERIQKRLAEKGIPIQRPKPSN
jgi:hypothetical protein